MLERLDEKNEMIMKLLHYFITQKNYSPIILQGVNNEIWLENMDSQYRIIRIVSNHIHNEEQLEYDVFKAKHIVGKIKRKTFTFNNVFLYKLEDDCLVRNPATVAIFRYPMTLPTKFKLYLPTLVTDKAELLYLHNPLKLEDIMKINEKYKFLCK